MRQLQRKKVGMGAGSGKEAFIALNGIHKQPVRFNMQLPMWFPATFKGVIPVSCGKRFFLTQKQGHYLFEFFHIIAALRNTLHIALEMRGVDRFQHLYAQLSEKIIGIFCIVKSLTLFNGFQGLACFLIGNFLAERQALFMGHPGQRHAAEVGNRQSHFRKHGCCFILDNRVNSGANIIIGGHRASPCFHYCSPHGHKVNVNTDMEGRHGLV